MTTTELTPVLQDDPAEGGRVWQHNAPNDQAVEPGHIHSIIAKIFMGLAAATFTAGIIAYKVTPTLQTLNNGETKLEFLPEHFSASAPYFLATLIPVALAALIFSLGKQHISAIAFLTLSSVFALITLGVFMSSGRNLNAAQEDDLTQIGNQVMQSEGINPTEGRQIYAPNLETNQPGKIELADGSTILYTLNRNPETHIIKPEITSWTKGEPVETTTTAK